MFGLKSQDEGDQQHRHGRGTGRWRCGPRADLRICSDFLKALWKEKLPPTTRHYLIFGYDTKELPWLTLNNDHVIDVESALFAPAQAESVRVWAIHSSHDTILQNKQTIQKVNEFLPAR